MILNLRFWIQAWGGCAPETLRDEDSVHLSLQRKVDFAPTREMNYPIHAEEGAVILPYIDEQIEVIFDSEGNATFVVNCGIRNCYLKPDDLTKALESEGWAVQRLPSH